MKAKWIKPLFLIAAIYDGVLGIAFLLVPGEIFAMYEVIPPNHLAYVQFPALLLLLFAIMFLRISVDPAGHRELILYGCGLKISYCSIAFLYDITTGISDMWMPWAWMDLVFLAAFLLAWRNLGKPATD
jgi:hypothetical protein